MTGPIPVPDKVTTCVPAGSVSVKTRVPVRFPLTVGLKNTAIAQFAPAARLAGQALPCTKSPLVPISEMNNGVVPVFVSVTVCCGLVVATCCVANVKLVADKLATPLVPNPVRATICGLPYAESVMVSCPDRVPVCRGWKVTVIVQFAATANVDGANGQVFVCE